MSQAENLLQVYKQARESNPDLRKVLLTATPHSKRSMKRAARCCRSSV